MRRVAITGIGNPMGAAVARALGEQGEMESILGIDCVPPQDVLPGVSFTRRAAGEPIADLFLERWIDAVIHVAWSPGCEAASVAPGIEQMLDACHRAGILQVVVGSSAMVYGPSWERPAPRPERAPLEGGSLDLPLVRALVRSEAQIERFSVEHPEVDLAVARPCRVVGEGLPDDLVELLRRPVAPLPSPMAPIQVCHVGDAGRALVAILSARGRGAYNVAPSAVLGPDDVAACAAGRALPVRASAVERALGVGRRWGLPTGGWTPARLRLVSEPWLVDSGRLIQELGFRFERGSAEALTEAASSARPAPGRVRRLLPRLRER